MGRGKPTYDLHEIQRLIGQGPISSWITPVAREGAARLRLDQSALVDVVLALTEQHFYKSMEAEKVPGLWQDVYHLEHRGIWLYIKLQLSRDGQAVVVQFKRK
jgi:hypothetical protein